MNVVDNWGDLWTVAESRDTGHGWLVHLGRPHLSGPHGKSVILTRELVEYLTALRADRGAVRLPICGTAVKRCRKVLGLNLYDDVAAWWEDHADELASLTETEFAARHGYSVARVSQMHASLFGKRLREPGWWQQEPARSLLVGEVPRAAVAADLGISVGAVGRLRWVLRNIDIHRRRA